MRRTEKLNLPLWDPEDRVLRSVFNEITERLDQIMSVPEVPVGAVMWLAAQKAPDGYLICDGALVSRTDYADLFAVIGTTFGAGDGSTTFQLPDLRAAFVRGAGSQNGYSATFGKKQEATAIRTEVGYRAVLGSGVNNSDKSMGGSGYGAPTNQTASDGGSYQAVRPYNIALTPLIKY
mgnify:FL=1